MTPFPPPVSTAAAAARSGPLVEAVGLGVTFTPGGRDDAQALAYRALSGTRPTTKRWALRDVTFRVGAGEALGVIGRSGAGKTTLCRTLAGLLKPDTGRVAVRGEVSALLSLGTGFNRDLSGHENIQLNGMMLGLSRRAIESLIPDIIEFSGVGRFIDQPLKSYSAGMKARLGFSIAAMLEPDILVLDESLSVGDIEFTARAGQRLQELLRRASLIIIVSHQLEFVTNYCTQALWLEAGRVRSAGVADDVVGAYRDVVRPPDRATRVPGPSAPAPRSAAAPAIAIDGVTVRYALKPAYGVGAATPRAPFLALDAVSFAIDEGEIVGIIGANGAGKTTLCKVLAGILRPDRGEVRARGAVTALLTMGTGLNQQLSGSDNIHLGGLMLGMSRRRIRRVYDDIVAFSELGPVIHEPIKHYSRGMRARLAFSTVTTTEPDLLVIDEALSAGDDEFSTKAATRMRELIDHARAVVVVTHNLTFVETVCTRALWLHAGRLVLDGEPAAVVRQYRKARGRPSRPSAPGTGITANAAARTDVRPRTTAPGSA